MSNPTNALGKADPYHPASQSRPWNQLGWARLGRSLVTFFVHSTFTGHSPKKCKVGTERAEHLSTHNPSSSSPDEANERDNPQSRLFSSAPRESCKSSAFLQLIVPISSARIWRMYVQYRFVVDSRGTIHCIRKKRTKLVMMNSELRLVLGHFVADKIIKDQKLITPFAAVEVAG